VLRADNLNSFMCRLSLNLGASTSWNPQGLSRPVMELLYLAILTKRCCYYLPFVEIFSFHQNFITLLFVKMFIIIFRNRVKHIIQVSKVVLVLKCSAG